MGSRFHGLDPSGRERRQQGCLIGVTTSEQNAGHRAKASIVRWRSVKHARRAQSPQLCETYAASDALVEGARVKMPLESITWGDFDAAPKRGRSTPRPEPRPRVRREELQESVDPELALAMDSKGLHEILEKNVFMGNGKIPAIEIPMVQPAL